MRFHEIRKQIHWVGAVDWNIRNFHGYQTEEGTTYNAYLIIDDKITLIDTVKGNLAEQMLFKISRIVDIDKIDYIVSNHSEMDHSGAIPKILELAPNAQVIATKQGQTNLRRHFGQDWNIRVVGTGDSVKIGRRTLSFIATPLLHWPDSMFTYCPEERLLFSNDAFGQHIASAERYDDELGWETTRRVAAKYYANIVTPFGGQVAKAIKAVADKPCDLICPSHGVIIRQHVQDMVRSYSKWSRHETTGKAVIVYDSMWGATERLATMLQNGLEEEHIGVVMRNLRHNHISNIMTDVLEAKLILLGSPTLNRGMLPTMGSFLTYMKGLHPKNRIGYVFGSYGWKGEAASQISAELTSMHWDLPEECIDIKFQPNDEELAKAFEAGKKLGRYLKEHMPS